MLAIAVAIVAVSYRATGCVGLQQCIGDPDRVEDQRIVRTAQAETDELQELDTDQFVGGHAAAFGAVVERDDLVKDFRQLEDLHWEHQDIIP